MASIGVAVPLKLSVNSTMVTKSLLNKIPARQTDQEGALSVTERQLYSTIWNRHGIDHQGCVWLNLKVWKKCVENVRVKQGLINSLTVMPGRLAHQLQIQILSGMLLRRLTKSHRIGRFKEQFWNGSMAQAKSPCSPSDWTIMSNSKYFPTFHHVYLFNAGKKLAKPETWRGRGCQSARHIKERVHASL